METSKTWLNWLRLYFFWILLTAVGWSVGRVFIEDYDLSGASLLIGFAVQGVSLGLGQWLVLRSQKFGAGWRDGVGWWIPSTVMGYILGFFVVVFFNTIELSQIGWAAYAAVVGMGQWFVLRRRVRMSGWWILATVVAWIAGQAANTWPFQEGLIVGFVTGSALVILSVLDYRKSPNLA